MFVFKQCKCGSIDFYDEDNGTWRCENCGRLAMCEYVNDKEEVKKDVKQSNFNGQACC